MSGSSYRTILRSSSIIGGAQVISIAVGLVKMKVVAVLLGPAGVGLAGLYFNLIHTASSVAALGLGTVGTRQIAAAHAEGGDDAVGSTRRALLWVTMALALVGAAIFWLFSGWIARLVFADDSRSGDVAWLSLGVALTVAAGSQGALLTGLRKLGDLARVTIIASLLSTALGVLALLFRGDQGIILMVLAAPLASFLVGHLYVARLGPPAGPRASMSAMSREWRSLITLGFSFMLSSVITTSGHLAVRTIVQRELGNDALGQFQAAWAIGVTYLGFVLSAMAADFYPRLSAVIHDHASATRVVNEQTEVALLLSAPVVLALLGLAPWIIHLLYSNEFGPAADILRWQLLGDVLKVLSWPLGFCILAAGAGTTYLVTQSLAMAVFVFVAWFGIPLMGVTATGVAVIALYVVNLPLVWILGGRRIGFRWSRQVKAQALAFLAATFAVHLSARWNDALGAVLGVSLAVAMTIWALVRIVKITGTNGPLERIVKLGERIQRWMKTRS